MVSVIDRLKGTKILKNRLPNDFLQKKKDGVSSLCIPTCRRRSQDAVRKIKRQPAFNSTGEFKQVASSQSPNPQRSKHV